MEGNESSSESEDDKSRAYKGTRPPRNRSNWEQRSVLEKVFQKNPYPDLSTRSELASTLGMTPRKIQVWFQNRRTKQKSQKIEGRPLDTLVNIANVNQQDPQTGNSLLFVAAAGGYDSVAQLLSQGASINMGNRAGLTPLYISVLNRQEKTVNLLLRKKYGCNVNIQDSIYGQTPLHIAAMKGDEAISLLLLSKGVGLDVNATDFEHRTPLHHAAVYGHTRLVKQLINCKANVNAVTKEGLTPLHCAALGGHVNAINLLLDHGADINFRDKLGYSPLCFSAREGKEDAVQVLISRGASIELATNKNWTPLHFAVYRRHLAVLKSLVEHGANVSAKTEEGLTAIEIAYTSQFNEGLLYLNSVHKSVF